MDKLNNQQLSATAYAICGQIMLPLIKKKTQNTQNVANKTRAVHLPSKINLRSTWDLTVAKLISIGLTAGQAENFVSEYFHDIVKNLDVNLVQEHLDKDTMIWHYKVNAQEVKAFKDLIRDLEINEIQYNTFRDPQNSNPSIEILDSVGHAVCTVFETSGVLCLINGFLDEDHYEASECDTYEELDDYMAIMNIVRPYIG